MSKGMKWFVAVWSLLTFLLLSYDMAHCSTVQKRPNSLGVVQTYESPWAYLLGNPTEVHVLRENDELFTNVTISPFGASLLNTEQLMLCGDQSEIFTDTRLRVVAYRRTARQMFLGVGCHELLKALPVQFPKEVR